MDIQKFIKDNNLESFPIGIAGCKISDDHFEYCNYDIVIPLTYLNNALLYTHMPYQKALYPYLTQTALTLVKALFEFL